MYRDIADRDPAVNLGSIENEVNVPDIWIKIGPEKNHIGNSGR